MVTQCFFKTSRFELVIRGLELVSPRFELVTRGFELVICGLELVARNACFTFSQVI